MLQLNASSVSKAAGTDCAYPAACLIEQPHRLDEDAMANPLSSLQQRSAAETLEYLGWACAHVLRLSNLPEHAHPAVTAQALVDAGESVRSCAKVQHVVA